MNEPPDIGEDDLQAHIDNQLPAPRCQAVQDYLARHPEEGRRIAAYRRQKEAMREALAGTLTEPLPPRLTIAGILAERRRPKWTPWLVAASIVLALGIGAAGGVLVGGLEAPDRTQRAMALLEQEALASHQVYAADKRHPVEVPGTEAPHLAEWLSNRLSRTVALPDLSTLGYHLIGGRLLATERGSAAALLMYDNDNGERITVLLRPMAQDLHAPIAKIRQDQVGGQAWIAKGLGIAVVAGLPETDLSPVSADIIRAFASSG
jgi:anti-sigma factor RsiW